MDIEKMGMSGGPEKPEDEAKNGLEDMREYAKLEFKGEVANVNHVEDFDYPLEDEVIVKVYEIKLKSGEKIFGVGGGWPMPMNNFYKQFSDPEKAADFHMYTIAKHFKIYDDAELKEYANWLEIPDEYR